MNPYRLLVTVTLINASPPFCSRASSTAAEKEEFPQGIMARMECRQADPSASPRSLKLRPDLSSPPASAVLLVTIPKVPDELHPVMTNIMRAKNNNRDLLIMVILLVS
jgi:hypothetical protein